MECSSAWDGLSAWGTAAQASFWVALEQPGPWGRDALVESRLNPELGRRWGDAALEAGGRMLLIRAPGQHVAGEGFQSRRVLVAGGLAGGGWLLEGVALTEDDFDALPWAKIAAGDMAAVREACPWLHPASAPVLLICTNAKRDRCCALRGRPIVHDLAEAGLPVWECTHTGGHRFAPTGVVLPLGQVMGRLTPELGREVLDAAASGRLAEVGELRWASDSAVIVVLAANGYPGTPDVGGVIGLPADAGPNVDIFHAGTRSEGGVLVAAGGRVLGVVGRAFDLTAARAEAYAAIDKLDAPSLFCRRDIAERAASGLIERPKL